MWKSLARTAIAAVLMNATAQSAPLDSYRWKARPVVVFGSENSYVYRQQLDLFKSASKGFAERDIVLIPVLGQEGSQGLRRAYRVNPEEFQVLLIGKDGDVKLRSRELVSTQYLFRLIDAMPMRRQEMR